MLRTTVTNFSDDGGSIQAWFDVILGIELDRAIELPTTKDASPKGLMNGSSSLHRRVSCASLEAVSLFTSSVVSLACGASLIFLDSRTGQKMDIGTSITAVSDMTVV